MHTSSTANALIQVRGPTVTYTVLKFNPIIDSRAHSIEIDGFIIRRGSERYTLDDLPVSRILTKSAREDIIFHTFELDEDERSTYHEIDFEIPEYDELVRVHFRVSEMADYPDMLVFEVEDDSGDWLPVDEVHFADLMPESFIRTMETSVIGHIDPYTLDMLPMAAE